MFAVEQIPFTTPTLDFHALAPEFVVVGTIVVLVLVDLFTDELSKRVTSAIAGLGLIAALIPVLTLAASDESRSMFGGAYVVDRYSVILKALFLVSGYIVVLMSTHYIGEGDYWEGEYYTLILASVLGMMMMGSSRDMVTIFISLELLSIPAYMLAAWRKRDLDSGEAGMKYYLMGVFATAIMLYGISLLYGFAGTTLLSGIATAIDTGKAQSGVSLAIVFVLVGFAFKISAVPFHTWAPDTYQGAPTPVTAFLAVASKAAGFVALINLVFIAFPGQGTVVRAMLVPLAAITMTVGNLIALRQTNVIRMLAFSGVAQAGYMLVPLAVADLLPPDRADEAMRALLIYLVIYAAMNLGAFAVVISVARRTGSAEIESMRGMFQWAPGMMMALSIFLGGFAGIPPAGGWFGKFVIFKTAMDAGPRVGYFLAGLIAVNSVIAAFYYVRIIWTMVSHSPDDIAQQPLRTPAALRAAVLITSAVVVLTGIVPSLVSRITDTAVIVSTPSAIQVEAPPTTVAPPP